MIRHALATVLVAAALLFAAPAHAQRGVDVALFRPALDGYGILSVERAETAPRWSFGFSLFASYASNPLRLAVRDDGAALPTTKAILDHQLVLDLGGVLGLTDWLELAVNLPLSYAHFTDAYGKYGSSADPMLQRTGFYAAPPYTNVPPPSASPLDGRAGFKARLLRRHGFGLAAAALVTLPFGNDSAFLGEGAPSFRPVLIADLTRGSISAAVNVGAIVRRETLVLDPYDVAAGVQSPRVLLDVGDELTWSVGLAWRFSRYAGAAVSAYGLVPLVHAANRPGDAARDVTVDLVGGVQLFATRALVVTVAAGSGVLTSAARHDDFRAVLGIAWAPSAASGGGVAGAGTDSDGDGVPDAQDLCPGEPEDRDGFEDDDGCPDRDNDGDGIPDALDRCPNEPEDRDGFADDDGCPDPDNDGDGIADAQDRCPNEPEDRDGFEDDDGCPDLDNDGDGIADAVDKCPNEPETNNGIDDDDGCPDSGTSGGAVAAVAGALRIDDKISFGSAEKTVPPRFRAVLDRIADHINAHRAIVRVRIEGHADDLGSPSANVAIAEARALAVREYLMRRGVAPERLQAVGYGGTRPLDRRRTPEARARNRRVEFVVVEQSR